MIDLSKIDVMILCGGLGTRIREITRDKIPKCMINIKGEPFLKLLVDELKIKGFERFIFCIGYKGVELSQYLYNIYGGYGIIISDEDKPLGTGGAVLNAIDKVESEYFFIMNGDTFCPIFFNTFVLENIHKLERKVAVGVSLLSTGLNTINTGIYFVNTVHMKHELNEWSGMEDKFSLEDSLFPNLLNCGYESVIVDEDENLLIDIGTPEGYKKALKYFRRGGMSDEM